MYRTYNPGVTPLFPPPFDGCSIPPDIYDIAFAWDPAPEVNRLLHLATENGIAVQSALELGCGTARLFPLLSQRIPSLVGIELRREMAEFARHRAESAGAELIIGDMSDFAIGRRFDLIYSTANTLRHILTAPQIERMWRCIASHLVPGGLFIADLEFGVEEEGRKLDVPATWYMARDDVLVHVEWCVTRPPDPQTRIGGIRWTFEVRDGAPPASWKQSFDLRAYDADEFLTFAEADGTLIRRGVYEIREPFLFPVTAARPAGRHLAVLQRRE